MTDWRTIDENTPRGKMLLLYGRQFARERGLISYKDWIVFTGYWDDIDSAWCATGSTYQGPFFHVTHWQPLPSPPSPDLCSGRREG